MTIVGIGLDIVELDRIERIWQRFGLAFARRILTHGELRRIPERPAAYLASRFAAKEAVVKALGTGFSQGVTFQQIEVAALSSNQPALSLHGRASDVARQLGVGAIHLSLTHGRDVAAAMVVLET
ncbi:MAG TPA: holo-[acyl-carrier-protein] synthase [Desulfonatronum sp.]|nr:holo-[acyl-carrier-protein] synthase [Desulfonatronum sp.]